MTAPESKVAAPVGGVLAVMDAHIAGVAAFAERLSDRAKTKPDAMAAAEELREVRAAVAELVAAAAKAAVALNNYRATGKPDYEALTNASDALNPALLPFQTGASA